MDPAVVALIASFASYLAGKADKKAVDVAKSVVAKYTIIPEEYQKWYLNALAELADDLYWAAGKDLVGKTFGYDTAGSACATIVEKAAKKSKLPEYWQYRVKAEVYKRFGNSKKSSAATAKATALGIPSAQTNDTIENLKSVGSDQMGMALPLIAGAALMYLLTKRK